MTFREAVLLTGCNKSVIARVFKVSRQTLYTWLHGHEPTQEINITYKNKLQAAIERAHEAGELPVSIDVQDKYKRLTAAIRKHMG